VSKRQNGKPPSDDPTLAAKLPGSMVSGGSIGDRIAAARERRGLSKSDLGRAIGKNYRMVQKWETGEVLPERDSIRLVAQVLAVTIEELLGVGEGQDPPFAAWAEFLATPEGAAMTPGERRMMQSLAWPPGREPTLAGYLMMLAALRGGSRERLN
jgi:transcriptional regulator with XRE-family HTH domain